MLEVVGIASAGLAAASPPGAVTFWVIFANWIGGEGWLQQHRRLPAAADRDAGSMHLVVTSVWAGVGIGLVSSFLLPGLSTGGRSEPLFTVGLELMAAGLALRRWAVAALGSAFTVTVGVQAHQELVARGPYRWVRHPSYTGTLLTLVGVGLVCSNWMALAALLLPFGAYGYRIQVEEGALSARFGDAFRSYCQRTTRLMPRGL
ncbi:MAG TPA: isoprenylcysteine carboxylmethyltransferase family protein [Candidatus Dormibacteraeota bacterium]|nr:isoprenylcysteine carboxylmethyltransferase family protein [Candidatus Dormibacteraeota bacterium]